MLKETIYSPHQKFKEVFSFKKMFIDLNEARFLGTQLFIRDRKGMFRQSFLGIVWAFLPPFFTAIVWIFLNGSGAVRIDSPNIPYPIFVFCGTLLFQTFTEAMTTPAQTVNAGKSMMAKLNFPREAFLISSFFTLLFNFFFKFLALIAIAIAFGVKFSWGMALFVPGVLAIIILGMSIGIFLIPFQMLFQDFGRMINLGSQVLMYMTPVVYPIPESGFLRTINMYNPITPFIDIPRNWFNGLAVEGLGVFLVVLALAVLLMVFGWMLYRITMPIIVERVGA